MTIGFTLAIFHQQRKHLADTIQPRFAVRNRPGAERNGGRPLTPTSRPSESIPTLRRARPCYKIFNMDGGYAAQDTHRQVERLSLPIQQWLDGDCLGINVRNNTKPVAFVKRAGLLWDVGGRIVQSEI